MDLKEYEELCKIIIKFTLENVGIDNVSREKAWNLVEEIRKLIQKINGKTK